MERKKVLAKVGDEYRLELLRDASLKFLVRNLSGRKYQRFHDSLEPKDKLTSIKLLVETFVPKRSESDLQSRLNQLTPEQFAELKKDVLNKIQ